MSKSSSDALRHDNEKLRKSLLSIGVDKEAVERLVTSRQLGNIVVPIYWKDGIVLKVNSFWLKMLPEFLESFAREFPDGQIRWDPDYRAEKPGDGDSAIHVFFSYQEDDQGDRWEPKPDLTDVEGYYKMIKRYSFKGDKQVPASRVIHGR